MTGPDFATAIIYAGPIVGIVIAVLIAALFVCNWLESREARAEAAYLARRDAARAAYSAEALELAEERKAREDRKARFTASPANQRTPAPWMRPVTEGDWDIAELDEKGSAS